MIKVAVHKCSTEKLSWEILLKSQENDCDGVFQ